jgi:putative transposase
MVTLLNLNIGTLVESEGRRFRIVNLLDLESVLGKDQVTGQVERLFIDKLAVPSPLPTELSEIVELSLINEADWKEANRRFSIIQPLFGRARRDEAVKIRAGEQGIHVSTIYRWMNLYERTGKVSSLIPRPKTGGIGKSRLSPEIEAVIASGIEDDYLSKRKPSLKHTTQVIHERCRNAGLDPPHPNTVRARVAMLSKNLKMQRRGQKKKAQETYTPILGHFPGADYPLAVVQIDHTLVDLMIVDESSRLAIGRPWITVAIDVFSRMTLGFYVSLDPPSAMSVGLCLAHAILPKQEWLARRNISGSWPCWGLPRTLHADNALEFRGNTLKRACEEYSINLEWRPVARPNFGGHIERLLGTFAEEIHALPGTTFSNVAQKGEYDSEKEASMTLTEFETWLATYIIGVYHQKEHSSLKMSPTRRYDMGIHGDETKPGRGLPPKIVDENKLRLDFMPYVERTIQNYGIVIDHIHYYHDLIRHWINAEDEKEESKKRMFLFRRDPRDISAVYFFDPRVKRYFTIPYRDLSRPSISLWELREALRKLSEEGRRDIDENAIFETHEQLRRIEEEAVRETKKARRQKQRRIIHRNIEKPKLDSPPPIPASAPVERFKPFEEIETW